MAVSPDQLTDGEDQLLDAFVGAAAPLLGFERQLVDLLIRPAHALLKFLKLGRDAIKAAVDFFPSITHHFLESSRFQL